MDTHAAVRQLEQAGASTALAEAMTHVLQEALGSTPTMVELRQFVLDQDLKLERLRAEMQEFRLEVRAEFGRIHEEFGRVHTTLARMQGTLTLHETRLSTTHRLAWAMVGLAITMLVLTLVVLVWR